MKTRMHSSRMRTGRSLTICCSLLPRGSPWSGGVLAAREVCLVQGGSPWSRGGGAEGGSGLPGLGGSPWSGGLSAWSQGGFSGDPPCEQNHRHV